MADSTTILTGNVALPKLYVSTDGGSTYDQIAKLVVAPSPGTSTDLYETTHTDVTDNVKRWQAGWEDGTEQEATIRFTEAGFQIMDALSTTDVLDWKLEWTDPEHATTDPKREWEGVMTQAPTMDMPIDNVWQSSITIKTTSKPVTTSGT